MSKNHVPFKTYKNLYTGLTLLPCWSSRFFDKLDQPLRIYSMDEVLGVTQWITKESWSLEKVFCRDQNSPVRLTVKGSSAVTQSQSSSSLAFAILILILIFLIAIGVFVWLKLSPVVIAVAAVLVVIGLLLYIVRVCKVYKSYNHVVQMSQDNEDNSQLQEPLLSRENGAHLQQCKEQHEEVGLSSVTESHSYDEDRINEEQKMLYQLWETFQVTRAGNSLCWFFFGAEMVFLNLWPFINMLLQENYALAGLFIFLAIFSMARHYFSARVLLQEQGSLDILEVNNTNVPIMDRNKWKRVSRLGEILRFSTGRARRLWRGLFVFLVIIFFMFSLNAIRTGEDTHGNPERNKKESNFLHDFEYKPTPNLPYPTCGINKGLHLQGTDPISLLDYSFLSTLAYYEPSVTQPALNNWFGNGTAVSDQSTVDTFKRSQDSISPVSYKLISFDVGNETLGVVSIRGTQDPWDVFVDVQLWSAAVLTQIFRAILPFGHIWTPIFDELVYLSSRFGSKSLEKISFYKETTKFVKHIEKNFTRLQLTGHSLGGGLAIISGAQTQTSTVAVSGPNAMISRLTFEPALTKEQLNTYTFNIVPKRDPVPMLDDLAALYQKINCLAPNNEIGGCHNPERSLCEIMVNCGTGPRPAICDCAKLYGYPEPDQIGNRTFEEACKYVNHGF
eukprot:CAMPEP_0195508244 /NCGR_PEP_ID=MMETSP0794_2-20130614/1506_1 /TAXON_ID=515487 /ORGANISM="Stephanopyxis turris, Strain CCMP 815" /LENGTH=672 /DNA_ID=CAMNT_0040635155 /DNA_START=331 /DNA_END=2349 /DNA_ORIENTATION=-